MPTLSRSATTDSDAWGSRGPARANPRPRRNQRNSATAVEELHQGLDIGLVGVKDGVVDARSLHVRFEVALVFTKGVEVACLCVEKTPTLVKLSLRSRSRLDVAALARQLSPGGGGHPRAAGVMLEQPLHTLMQTLPDILSQAVRRETGESG